MTKYRKTPVVVEAVQWWKNGDHPQVSECPTSYTNTGVCHLCDRAFGSHGQLLVADCVICPGDWIVTDATGAPHQCRSYLFTAIYEEIFDDD